jgi:hypothetical protein
LVDSFESEYHVDKISSEEMPKKKGTEMSVKQKEKFRMMPETISGYCFGV